MSKEDLSKGSIKSWSEDDRPREKLRDKGRGALSDAELIAILIGSGNSKQTAVDLSRDILKSFNNSLLQLSRSSLEELMRFKGIGEAKAISIAAALELGRRRAEDAALEERPQIKNSRQAYNILAPAMRDLPHEMFKILLLDRASKVMSIETISSGGVAGTVVDVRMVFRPALDRLASAIILCHNHPSGNPSPSEADLTLTKKLHAAGKVLDIAIADHIIVADSLYYSFADEGQL